MYDYQAMCKVPYHHHSGARPLLSVRIHWHATLSGLGCGGFSLERLQHLDVARSPKELGSCLLSNDGNVQTHLRKISEAVMATDGGFQFGFLLAYRISLKIGRTRERTGTRLCQASPKSQGTSSQLKGTRNAFTGHGFTQQLKKESCTAREERIWEKAVGLSGKHEWAWSNRERG